jgi:hypothetical protein
MAEAGFDPKTRLHDCRHAVATMMLEQGVHPAVASAALGQSSVAFTMDTYQHVVDQMTDQAAAALDDAFASGVSGLNQSDSDRSLAIRQQRRTFMPLHAETLTSQIVEKSGFTVVRPPGLEPGTCGLTALPGFGSRAAAECPVFQFGALAEYEHLAQRHDSHNAASTSRSPRCERNHTHRA